MVGRGSGQIRGSGLKGVLMECGGPALGWLRQRWRRKDEIVFGDLLAGSQLRGIRNNTELF